MQHLMIVFISCDFLRVPCTEFWTSLSLMKAENLRNPIMVLHVRRSSIVMQLMKMRIFFSRFFNRNLLGPPRVIT